MCFWAGYFMDRRKHHMPGSVISQHTGPAAPTRAGPVAREPSVAPRPTMHRVPRRDEVARTLRAEHIKHGKTDFATCTLRPCSKIGVRHRRLVAEETKRIYGSLSGEMARRDFDQICEDG